MSSLSFIHAADLHLDSPFVGLQQVDETIALRLREATFNAFDALIHTALERKVDFFLVAGDVYDGADRSLRAQVRFRDGLLKLAKAGIPSYVVHGNHDPLDGWISDLRWPDNVTIFQGHDGQSHTFSKNGEPLARIHGISYPSRKLSENFGRKFAREGPEPFQIGLFHCNMNGDPRHDNYAPRTIEELKLSGLDYWALGHVHEHAVVHKNNPFVAYPGNMQGRHIREAGPRGALLVHTNGSSVTDYEFLTLDSVRWLHLTIDIQELPTFDDLLEQIRERAAAHDRSCILRVTLTGRGALHRELDQKLAGFLVTIREVFANSHPDQFIWVERLENQTRPAVDLQERAKAEDFVGTLLRLADELTPDDVRRIANGLWQHSRAEKFLTPLQDDEISTIMKQAVALVADPLMEDE